MKGQWRELSRVMAATGAPEGDRRMDLLDLNRAWLERHGMDWETSTAATIDEALLHATPEEVTLYRAIDYALDVLGGSQVEEQND